MTLIDVCIFKYLTFTLTLHERSRLGAFFAEQLATGKLTKELVRER